MNAKHTPESELTLQLEQMASLKKIAEDFSELTDGYIFTRLGAENPTPESDILAPLRFNVMTIFLCRKGTFSVELNQTTYNITPGSLMLVPPGALLVTEGRRFPIEGLEGDMLFISIPFLRSVNFDLNAVNIRLMLNERRPVMELRPAEFELMSRYLELIHEVTIVNRPNIFVTTISRNLIAATFYQILQFTTDRAGQTPHAPESTEGSPARRANYVHDFIRLVQANYRRERTVGFYADRLCISPKYLSLLVKEATGQSASAWINGAVILEAKNLLRFSGKNIQQIAYELNFVNQSSFGKYFKHLTGMSPSEYQRS